MHTIAAQLLGSGAGINDAMADGQTLLHMAMQRQDSRSALFLLEHQADINVRWAAPRSPRRTRSRRTGPGGGRGELSRTRPRYRTELAERTVQKLLFRERSHAQRRIFQPVSCPKGLGEKCGVWFLVFPYFQRSLSVSLVSSDLEWLRGGSGQSSAWQQVTELLREAAVRPNAHQYTRALRYLLGALGWLGCIFKKAEGIEAADRLKCSEGVLVSVSDVPSGLWNALGHTLSLGSGYKCWLWLGVLAELRTGRQPFSWPSETSFRSWWMPSAPGARTCPCWMRRGTPRCGSPWQTVWRTSHPPW